MKKLFDKLFDTCGMALGCLLSILIIALVLGLVFGAYCLEAWLIMLAWNYALCAMFTTLPLIPNFWVSFGLMFLVDYITIWLGVLFHSHKSKKEEKED